MGTDGGAAVDDAAAMEMARRAHPGAARSLLLIAATAGVLWAGLYVGVGLFLGVAFGAYSMLASIAIVLALVVAALAVITRDGAGRPRVLAAFTVTFTAVASQVVALVYFGEIPMIWVKPGFELVFPVVAVASALVLGLFLGPRWVRVAGAVAAAAIVGCAFAVLRPEPPAIDPHAVLSEEEQFAQFRDLAAGALVSDAAGSTVVYVDGTTGPGILAVILTADGGVVEISHDPPYPPDGEWAAVYPCWSLSHGDMGLEPTDAIEDYADWCVPDDDGWARTDGTGYARTRDDGNVTVMSAYDFYVGLVGGQRPATAAEVVAALANLRLITDEEMRVAFENQKVEGER